MCSDVTLQAASAADGITQACLEGTSPTCRGGALMGRGLTAHPLSPPLSMKAAGGDADLQMQQYWEKQHQPPPPPTCCGISLSTVCLSFLPSDNQTLISLASLSWSRSFLSQFR